MGWRILLAVGLLFTGLCFAQDQTPSPPQPTGPSEQGGATGPAQPVGAAVQPAGPPPTNTQCIDCHSKSTPPVVIEWKQSKHSQVNVGCIDCHGADHTSADDVSKVKIAKASVCARCHQTQVDQDRKGKHSRALGAMKTVPNGHWRLIAAAVPVGGGRACTDCHRTGSPRSSEELHVDKLGGIEGLGLELGAGACSSCHSRHSFSVQEARQPQTCEFCHSGPDADQWGMYSTSRHGILFDLKQRGFLPAGDAVPSCQTCHMPNGDHEVHTAWGYRGIMLPMPDDKQWAADRTELFKALNIIGAEGEDNPLKINMRGTEAMRFTREDWQRERDKTVKVCLGCHSEVFAKQQLQDGDNMIRDTDHLLAEAIGVVSGLYKDGLLTPPQAERNYPWLTRFDPPPTIIEQKLEEMYSRDRMSAFQGAFHSSPEYATARGRAQMESDLGAIKDLAAQLRRNRAGAGGHAKAKAASSGKTKADEGSKPH